MHTPHTYLIIGQSLFLPHVLEQVQCLRENTNLVPVRGEMGGEQHIPGRGRGRERERERDGRDGEREREGEGEREGRERWEEGGRWRGREMGEGGRDSEREEMVRGRKLLKLI